MFSRFPFFFLLGLTAVGFAAAQSVRWQPAGGFLERGQSTDLVLLFENCEPDGEIALPPIARLTLGNPQRGQQTSSNIINGQITTRRLVYYSYAALPTGEDPIEIPAFTVSTDVGPMQVPAARFEVREATVGDTAIPVSQVAQSTLDLGSGELWAGQVIPLSYQLEVSARFRAQLGGAPTWDPSPLVVEEWGEPARESRGVGTDARNLLTYSTRGYINRPGTYAVPSVQQLVNIGIPTAGFLQTLRAEQYAITSDSPPITVRPLPTPAPATFQGAVGTFSLTSRVVPETAEVGEPVTWTLELNGTGNWPDIPGLPTREASRTFRVVQPDAQRTLPEGKLFDGTITEDVVLIPTQPGDFTLGPVRWTYFDPIAGTYQTVATTETRLTVTAPATAPSATVSPGPADNPLALPPATPSTTVSATPAPSSPSMIPLEVLPGSAAVAPPLPWPLLGFAGGLIAAIFPTIWLILSGQRARRLDPGRSARLARSRLVRNLTLIGNSTGVARDRLLLAWQRDAAVLWAGTIATAPARLFKTDPAWITLWQEVEQALYAEHGELPVDWVPRAQKALQQKRAPRFPLFSILAPRHLFPVILVGLLLSGIPSSLADPIAAYQTGDFESAEEAWRKATLVEPTDWIAHHNLALALGQQNRWAEAGVHAAVAFVQHPRHPSTRWHLAYTLERSGYTPPVIGAFLHPSPSHRLAQLASPAEWRGLLLAGVTLGVGGLVLVLLPAYGYRVVGGRTVSWLLGVGAVALMASSLFSIQIWGTTADRRAALTWEAGELRSIPTDLNSEQQTTPLAAGSLCRVEKAFLGWRLISFPNGQTGWVRQESLVPLWERIE